MIDHYTAFGSKRAPLETPVDDEELRKHIAKMFCVLVEAAACGELAPGKDPAIQATLH